MIGNWKMPLAKNSKKIGFSFYDKIDCFFLWLWKGKDHDYLRRRGARALLRALLAGGKKSVQQTWCNQKDPPRCWSHYEIGALEGELEYKVRVLKATPLAPLATLGSMSYAATCDVFTLRFILLPWSFGWALKKELRCALVQLVETKGVVQAYMMKKWVRKWWWVPRIRGCAMVWVHGCVKWTFVYRDGRVRWILTYKVYVIILLTRWCIQDSRKRYVLMLCPRCWGISSGAQVVLCKGYLSNSFFTNHLQTTCGHRGASTNWRAIFVKTGGHTRLSKNKITLNNELNQRATDSPVSRKLRRLAINKNNVYNCSILFMSAKQCEALARKQLRSQLQNAKRKNESPEKREIRLRKQREINNRNRQVDGWQEYQQAYHTIRTIRLSKSD